MSLSPSSRLSLILGGGKGLNGRLQARQLVGDDIPNDAIGQPLILVPQHVTDAPDLPPWNLRPRICNLVRNSAAGFGYNLKSPLNYPAQLPAPFKILKRFAAGYLFHPSNRLQDIVDDVVELACRQKTRNADRSMSAFSIG